MQKKQKPSPKKAIKKEKLNIKIGGLDTDKAEYQQIVLSNANNPERDFYKGY